MTHAFDPKALPFYITMPAPCPYLPGNMERKIFTPIDPISGSQINDVLTHSGFRRSQNVIYRPACDSCNLCKSLRVLTNEFTPTPRFRRTQRRNADLLRETVEPFATQEQFSVLEKYLATRHQDGGMAEMDFARYEMMVEDCAADTRLYEYRLTDGKLIACCITDTLRDGLSMVYSFFDPDYGKRSLGNFMILDHIKACTENGYPYLYLGYWVKDSRKMDYKAKFKPNEILGHRGWEMYE